MFVEIPSDLIQEIRSTSERRDLDSSGPSFVQVEHIIYARQDSTGDWVLRLATGVELVLKSTAETFLRERLLNQLHVTTL